MTKTNFKSENGRSMVEMLGVLAIIGVLSVTGIAGYSAAMRKYRANVLLNQASIAAADIAGQIASGSPNLDLSGHNASQDFGSISSVKGANGLDNYQEGDDQFTLVMEDVDEEICALMQQQLGTRSVVRGIVCDSLNNQVILTFNKDLSNKPIASDFDEDKEGCEANGHKYCEYSGSCVGDDEECGCSETVPACQKCDTKIGSFIADDEKNGEDCTTSDGKAGTCIDGICGEKQNYVLGQTGNIFALQSYSNNGCPEGYRWAGVNDIKRDFVIGSGDTLVDWPFNDRTVLLKDCSDDASWANPTDCPQTEDDVSCPFWDIGIWDGQIMVLDELCGGASSCAAVCVTQ